MPRCKPWIALGLLGHLYWQGTGPLSLPAVVAARPRFRRRVKAAVAVWGVLTEGRSGIQANGSKGSAKHVGDDDVPTACYSAPPSCGYGAPCAD